MIARHCMGNTTHLVREETERLVITECGRQWFPSTVVYIPRETTARCFNCRENHARRIGKKPYWPPTVTRVHGTNKKARMRKLLGVKKLTPKESAELAQWQRWTGAPHPSVIGWEKVAK